MKTVTFGFSKAKSKTALFSKAICWAQGTPFSHVYIKFNWAASGSNLIYQASAHAVNFETEWHFNGHAQIVHEVSFDVADECWQRVAHFIVDNLGKPYSILQIAGFAFKLLGAKLGIKCIKPIRNGKDQFICSELGAEVFRLLGNAEHLDSENTTPKDLYDLLMAYTEPGSRTVDK
jgi:hypothetical protein